MLRTDASSKGLPRSVFDQIQTGSFCHRSLENRKHFASCAT